MNKTWILVKTMLKMQSRRPEKNDSKPIIFVGGMVLFLAIALIYVPFINHAVRAIYSGLQPLGQESLLLGLLFMIVHLLLFLTSIVSVLNAFYFADDIEVYLALPLHPFQLLAGKAAGPFLYLYLLAGALFLPIFSVYGSVSGAGALYYVYGVLLFVLMPIIPFTIASVLLMVIMRFVNISKNKERSKVIAGIASFAVIIGINIAIRTGGESDDLFLRITSLIQEQDGLLRQFTLYYPPAYLSAQTLNGASAITGLVFLSGIIAMSAGFLCLFAWLGQLVYLKGVLGINTGNKRRVSTKGLSRHIKMQPIHLSYLKKELKIIIRTPAFFLQCVAQSLFVPVFLMIIFVLDFGNSEGFDITVVLTEKQLLLLFFVGGIFLLGTNATSFSSFSREGKSWMANLYLPLDPKQVVFSKIAAAWTINLITIGILLIIGIFIGFPPALLGAGTAALLLGSWYSSSIGTLLDLWSPIINWTDEQEVFKGRFLGLGALAIEVATMGLLTFFLWRLPVLENLLTTAVALMIILLIAIFVTRAIIHRQLAKGQFHKI